MRTLPQTDAKGLLKVITRSFQFVHHIIWNRIDVYTEKPMSLPHTPMRPERRTKMKTTRNDINFMSGPTTNNLILLNLTE